MSRRRCVTRDSTCRLPSSRCACRSPRNPSSPSAARRSRPSRWSSPSARLTEGVSGPLVAARVEDSPGCTASDYDGLPVQGAVVLVDRGTCQFSVKQSVAAERGAVALIVANNEDGDEMGGTLGEKTNREDPGHQHHQGLRRAAARRAGQHHHQAQGRGPRRAHPQRHRPDEDRLHRRRGDGRRPSGQRAGGAGHQRQRFGRGRCAGNRTAAGPFAAGAERRAVRLLGGRGARAAGVEQLRRIARRRSAQGHRAVSELRHARLAEPGLLHLRR